VEDVTSQLKDWERAHRKDIVQLVALINRIIQVIENCGGSTAIRYNTLTDKLVIEKTERKKMLPDDLYALWTKHNGVSQKDPVPPKKDSVVTGLSAEGTAGEIKFEVD
jgi:hypothetical protein